MILIILILDVIQNSVLAELYAKYYKENTGNDLPTRAEQDAQEVGASTDFGNVSALGSYKQT